MSFEEKRRIRRELCEEIKQKDAEIERINADLKNRFEDRKIDLQTIRIQSSEITRLKAEANTKRTIIQLCDIEVGRLYKLLGERDARIKELEELIARNECWK